MKCPITATGDDTIDPVSTELLNSFDTSIRIKEFLASRCLKNRSASVNDIGRANAVQHLKVSRYHPRIPTDDTNHLEATLAPYPLNCPYVSIHAGSISATGHYPDPFDFILHDIESCQRY
jgi:hypothetical protein